ncbi:MULTISPECIES: hypothetical protein [Sutcliffiella]|uniref:Uncharacterized protein n=1 Tax=Sutcliffiella cohnii TaxID=33932 RepID=A0A223KUB4_9BACI|nr:MULTISPECIES: hypothetical protein [Sutcliffiella]AST93056.1 hypothetical protein BC6307_18230 [Sutcliffiella cohnii]WBL14259.1 hypothetical protein O1A01_20610 [Sutcliffiella sp. NC1]
MESSNTNGVEEKFFEKIKQDPNLQDLFNNIDFDRYKHHPETFYSHAFEEGTYSEEDIANAHLHLSLEGKHFDSMIDHFISSLDSNSDTYEKAKQALERYRNIVIK